MRAHWKLILLSCVTGAFALAFALATERLPLPDDSRPRAETRGSGAGSEAARAPGGDEGPDQNEPWVVSAAERADALARAHLWRKPARPIAKADLGLPRGPGQLDCRFEIDDIGGTTPKFHCLLAEGSPVRVKYGLGAEIPAEAAATRLLSALGFGADSVMLVERLRCYGCPKEPFVTMRFVEATRTTSLFERVVDHDRYTDFTWVALEEKFPARPIETEDQKGWAFHELDLVDPSRGGAPRSHLDALRLMAVFLTHWDNKPDNQRLVCLPGARRSHTRCAEPFLLLQDVGATFGPNKLDLTAWEKSPVWQDRPTCTLSMRELPYHGGTFGSVRVSEEGRQFLLGLLGQLSEQQVSELFAGARFDKPRSPLKRARPISDWVRVFTSRLEQLRNGPPCPAV
jgi:hypothetical protein